MKTVIYTYISDFHPRESPSNTHTYYFNIQLNAKAQHKSADEVYVDLCDKQLNIYYHYTFCCLLLQCLSKNPKTKLVTIFKSQIF